MLACKDPVLGGCRPSEKATTAATALSLSFPSYPDLQQISHGVWGNLSGFFLSFPSSFLLSFGSGAPCCSSLLQKLLGYMLRTVWLLFLLAY